MNLTDDQLDQQAAAIAAAYGLSYSEALHGAFIMAEHGLSAERASVMFSEDMMPSEEWISSLAEVEAFKRRIPYNQALNSVMMQATHTAGAKRFYSAVQHGSLPSDEDMDAAARVMAANGTHSYAEALRHLSQVIEFGDATMAMRVAFSEGKEITDDMVHSATLAHMMRTGAGYTDALRAVMDTISVSVGAQFAEAVQAADPQQGLEIEIFKAGTHIDSSGGRQNFTVNDVKRMAQVYDPTKREAPMVKGHPGDDAPAYGWIASLRATEDGRLMARATQWDQGFLDELKQGRYKKRSASFYAPSHPNNPVQGAWYLRHLGWLGAVQPAIGGLADMREYADMTDEFLSFTL